MKVGIIGSGVVGQTLAAGFVKHGHQVEIGTRDPAKLEDWSAKNPAPQSNLSRKPRLLAMLWSSRSGEKLRNRR